MRIVLGMTIHNEIEYGPHIWQQLDETVSLPYDDIVLLDDGSTDGTWDVIKEYAAKDNRVHAFRNAQNSITSRGNNRWLQLWQHMSKYNPTWVNIKACDQLYSKELKKDFRSIIERFQDTETRIITLPLAHLWRSMYWYRCDRHWGREVTQHLKLQFLRFHPGWKFPTQYHKARFHQGNHIPVFPGHQKRTAINSLAKNRDSIDFPYIILHLGHTTHEKKEAKFRWTMEASLKGFPVNTPGPKNLPPVENWLKYNGIKGFYEFCIELKRAPQIWFEEKIPENLKEPVFHSFYDVIKEYNPSVAEGYKREFERFMQRRFKEGKQVVVRMPPVKVVMDQVEKSEDPTPKAEVKILNELGEEFPKCDNQRKVQGAGPVVNANFKPPRFYKKEPRSN